MRDAIAVVVLALLFISFLPAPLQAGPFENFFKKIRRAMTAPQSKPASHKTTHRQTSHDQTEEAGDATVHAPPNGSNTRSTKRATAQKSGKADLPYATPVPGKKGFVTSPFAPDSGYIDVRDFPPGTEVKDPYTGKTFLTP